MIFIYYISIIVKQIKLKMELIEIFNSFPKMLGKTIEK